MELGERDVGERDLGERVNGKSFRTSILPLLVIHMMNQNQKYLSSIFIKYYTHH